jgi:hypothetical protein
MKRLFTLIILLCLAATGFSQSDSTVKNQPDTIISGKFVIIKRNRAVNENGDSSRLFSLNIGNHHRKHHNSALSTNWLIFDLGFANYTDNTNYAEANQSSYLHASGGAAFSKDDFHLKAIKSSNVDIWLFMQKLDITRHVLNLKYGFGLEMFNFRYNNSISYNGSPAYVYRDTVSFAKDKLFASYLTVPLMLNVNTAPKRNNGFTFSAGLSAGYLIGSHTKQVSAERGKQKIHDDFDLNPWRFAYVAELGLGPIRLYGSYSINPLHNEALKQYPYTVGIRFSNW